MNTTQIKSFVTPEGTVRFTNINVDVQKKRFTLTMGLKEKGKRKFTEQQVAGTLTSELADWLSLATPEKIQIVDATKPDGTAWVRTGRNLTGFQKYCNHLDIHVPLQDITFESENCSEDRKANPFRLVMLEDANILTLVNVAKRRKKEVIDPTTGATTIHYSVRFAKLGDKIVKAFIRPSEYRRLVIQSVRTVELAPAENANS